MGKNNNNSGIIYSTNPDFIKEEENEPAIETLAPSQQKLKVLTDTKHRAGKTVTLVQGFLGKEADLESLTKTLKNLCGSGGSLKDGEIIIQGNHVDKIKKKLTELKYPIK